MDSPLQKKSLGIVSALLTIVHVTTDFITQPSKIFLRSKETTACVCGNVVCVVMWCVCFFLLSFLRAHLNSVSKTSRDYT